jgi:hypothetical protein
MRIQELLIILQNRLIALTEARKSALAAGDPEKVIQIDNDLLTTNISIDQIKRMLDT